MNCTYRTIFTTILEKLFSLSTFNHPVNIIHWIVDASIHALVVSPIVEAAIGAEVTEPANAFFREVLPRDFFTFSLRSPLDGEPEIQRLT